MLLPSAVAKHGVFAPGTECGDVDHTEGQDDNKADHSVEHAVVRTGKVIDIAHNGGHKGAGHDKEGIEGGPDLAVILLAIGFQGNGGAHDGGKDAAAAQQEGDDTKDDNNGALDGDDADAGQDQPDEVDEAGILDL